MLKEIQVNKRLKRLYLMDENYNVYAEFPIGTEFYEGHNDNDEPFSNADNGVYSLNRVDIDYPRDVSAAYGYAYINIDERGRAIHGGGTNLGYVGATEPYQSDLLPTYGCFRMYNAQVLFVAQEAVHARDNGVDVVIHVVE